MKKNLILNFADYFNLLSDSCSMSDFKMASAALKRCTELEMVDRTIISKQRTLHHMHDQFSIVLKLLDGQLKGDERRLLQDVIDATERHATQENIDYVSGGSYFFMIFKVTNDYLCDILSTYSVPLKSTIFKGLADICVISNWDKIDEGNFVSLVKEFKNADVTLSNKETDCENR